jgi:hypothetical protein
MQQKPITDPDVRVLRTHRTTFATIRPTTLSRVNLAAGHPRTHPDLPRNSRNMHSVYYFCREETRVRCHMDDIAVDMTGGNIPLFVRKTREINVGPRPASRYYNSRLFKYRFQRTS